MSTRHCRNRASLISLVGILCLYVAWGNAVASPEITDLWSHHNLYAWAIVPFDARKRMPEEGAEMLETLGIRTFAYDWREKDIPTFEVEIEALARHDIKLMAWWFPLEADDPKARMILESFKRHSISPQLWVPESFRGLPSTPEEWSKLLPNGIVMPNSSEEFERLSESDRVAIGKVWSRLHEGDFPRTSEEKWRRLNQETDRISALVKLAAPYGSKVELYSHHGWYGIMPNLVAVIESLKKAGVTNVGIVYNFSTAHDDRHDDTAEFPTLWKNIKRYVVAVNITGIPSDKVVTGGIFYPSQGDQELQMMRTIQESGWTGPIGIIAEKGGDAEVTLRNYITGVDWLANELKRAGSGGPRPFPSGP